MEYGKEYFDYQRNIGAFGGVANLFKFTPYLRPGDRVLDFGCGGGYLLTHLNVAQKAGLEVNPEARQQAEEFGLTVYSRVEDIPDGFATVIISNHVLEHVERPVDELRSLQPKLMPGGRVVFVVPHQRPNEAYRTDDPNQHLYTWNPLTFGNLFRAAGYTDIEVDVIRHAWTPGMGRILRRLGRAWFDRVAHLNALRLRNYQIRAVARRP